MIWPIASMTLMWFGGRPNRGLGTPRSHQGAAHVAGFSMTVLESGSLVFVGGVAEISWLILHGPLSREGPLFWHSVARGLIHSLCPLFHMSMSFWVKTRKTRHSVCASWNRSRQDVASGMSVDQRPKPLGNLGHAQSHCANTAAARTVVKHFRSGLSKTILVIVSFAIPMVLSVTDACHETSPG